MRIQSRPSRPTTTARLVERLALPEVALRCRLHGSAHGADRGPGANDLLQASMPVHSSSLSASASGGTCRDLGKGAIQIHTATAAYSIVPLVYHSQFVRNLGARGRRGIFIHGLGMHDNARVVPDAFVLDSASSHHSVVSPRGETSLLLLW